jgi:hypothetical protein
MTRTHWLCYALINSFTPGRVSTVAVKMKYGVIKNKAQPDLVGSQSQLPMSHS